MYLAFFVSGAAAILYEVMWVRLLALAFGGVTLVVAIVTGLFLLGLALGAVVGGSVVDKIDRRWGTRGIGLWYVGLEVLIGVLGFVSWKTFASFGLISGDWRWLVAGGLVLGQAVFAGATWPTMYKLLLQLGWQWKVAGLITFLNTLGGAVGAILAAFLLVGNIGVGGAVLAAVAGNFLAGLIVGSLVGVKTDVTRKELVTKQVKKVRGNFDWQRHWQLIVILGLTGFWGMAMEILWTRAFGLILGTSVYAFALVLAVILLGLALGGLVVNWWKRELTLSGLLTVVCWWAIFVGLGMVILPKLPGLIAGMMGKLGLSFAAIQVWSIASVTAVILIPSLLSGIVLPWGVAMIKSAPGVAGNEAGTAYFINTFGAVAGGVAAAVWMLPLLGLQLSMMVLVGLAGLVTILYKSSLKVSWRQIGLVAIVILGVLAWGFWGWDKHKLASAAYIYGESTFDPALKLLFYKDGTEATITATQRKGATSLRINGKADASSGDDMATQVLSGFLPIVLHPGPERVMILGLGSGVTAAVSMQEETIEELIVLEIEDAVVEVAERYFSKENSDVLTNPKLKLVIQDGRNYLLSSEEQFDVISSEPSNPWTAGGATLFTQEFFELGKGRLAPGGIFFQWLQLYSMRPGDMKTILATFRSVFPYTQIWLSTLSGDSFLVGSNGPIQMDWNRLVETTNQGQMKEYLQQAEIEDEIGLLSLFVTGNEGLGELAAGAEIHTDGRPILEYRLPWGLLTETRADNSELFREVWGEVDFVSGMPAEMRGQLERTRNAKLLLIKANEHFFKGEIEEAKDLAEQAFDLDRKVPPVTKILAQIYSKLGSIYQALRGDKDESQIQPEIILDLWEKAIELKPDFFDPYPRLAEAYIGLKDFEKAEGLLDKAQKHFPWSGEMVMYQGILASELEEQGRAKELMLNAIELEPNNYVIRNNLAHLYSLQKQPDLALEQWKISLKLNPDQPRIYQVVKNAEKLKRMQQ